jgi:hypothetical protein
MLARSSAEHGLAELHHQPGVIMTATKNENTMAAEALDGMGLM